jgi:hypothetical protein
MTLRCFFRGWKIDSFNDGLKSGWKFISFMEDFQSCLISGVIPKPKAVFKSQVKWVNRKVLAIHHCSPQPFFLQILLTWSNQDTHDFALPMVNKPNSAPQGPQGPLLNGFTPHFGWLDSAFWICLVMLCYMRIQTQKPYLHFWLNSQLSTNQIM